ncbi:MAG: NAD(P)/FAD-dependent oxidoreductase [archaeon]|nr:NAD(P)/FAD-dependent oxidoreductase [archaeon]MCR4323600.1 NAD(P)/FAD-dependent oxidoreductase [Nanoarchaeota archaeon]
MAKKNYSCDVLIIGTGVTGLATAMYSARFNLKTIVVGDLEGGTITQTDEVSNYPGFKNLTGTELANKIKEHAMEYDITILGEFIDRISKEGEVFKAESSTSIFEAKTVILTTGTKAKELGVPGEKELMGRGVHTCALCDAPFYKNKILGVVGGSDSAAKEALLLSRHAEKVYIIYRGESIRPEPVNGKKIKESKNIKIINNTNIVKIVGEGKLDHVVLDKPYNGSKEFKLDGVFIEIGHIPLSDLAKQLKVNLNEKGEVKVNRNSETNILGFFAAGDVIDTEFKQAITGVAEGVTASYFAYQYIQNKS